MKRILSVLTLIVLSIVLVSCNVGPTKRKLPKVNGRNEVDLTYEELIKISEDILADKTLINKNIKHSLNGKFLNKIKISNEEIITSFSGNVTNYLDTTNNMKSTIDVEGDFLKTKIKLLGTTYLVNQDNLIYYDLASKISTGDFNKDESFKLKESIEDSMLIPDLMRINITKELILNTLLKEENKKFVEKYDALKFYKKENYFAVKFVFNKALVKNDFDLFDMTMKKLKQFRKFDGEIVAVFENNQLTEFGADINIEGTNESVYMLLDLNYDYEIDVLIKEFPDFSDYKEGSYGDIIKTY